MTKETIKEMLKMIDAKIEHIEDITADNRAIMIKLVKQSNQIVQFLKQIEIEDITEDYSNNMLNVSRNEKLINLKELLDEFADKHKDLKEFEEELKKNKSQLTPGEIGES